VTAEAVHTMRATRTVWARTGSKSGTGENRACSKGHQKTVHDRGSFLFR
jgi:hypothetical protein